MPDEHRLAPGQTVHVTLLTGHLLNHLHGIARPAATGCAACGRPWTVHDLKPLDFRAPCERCGAILDSNCFYAVVATPAEVVRHEDPEDNMDGLIFMCLGCRS